MGNDTSGLTPSQIPSIPQNCKLYSILPISSPQEQEHMTEILQRRNKLAECPNICTLKTYSFLSEDSTFSCGTQKKLIVYYDDFEYKLSDVPIKNYNLEFTQQQICTIIYSVCQALSFLRNWKLFHGDISLDNIVKRGKVYKVVDKMFIKNGINAYEKVLEGESGFISPKQMVRIRYGFVKESPDLTEADDIFGLGMVVLQLASAVPSSLCYKEMNIRFNQDILNRNIETVKKSYSPKFSQLLQGMLAIQQSERLTLSQIRNNPLIKSINQNPTNSNTTQISLQQSKLRQNYTKQSFNSGKASTIMTKNIQQKPLTPNAYMGATRQTTKQPTPNIPNTPRTPQITKQQYYSSNKVTPNRNVQIHQPIQQQLQQFQNQKVKMSPYRQQNNVVVIQDPQILFENGRKSVIYNLNRVKTTY